MDTKPPLILMALVVIFSLEGVFPHYRGRWAIVKHAVPHVLTAITSGLLTKFALAG